MRTDSVVRAEGMTALMEKGGGVAPPKGEPHDSIILANEKICNFLLVFLLPCFVVKKK